jgi:DNA-binding transcriptional LysR family regulator
MHGAHTLNLRQLEHLVAVAEEGSLAAAAQRVHLSQPALTRSIQALEKEAGLALCDRGARGVTLTAAGRLVVDRAQRILFETGCLSRDLLLIQQHEMGEVRFGLGPLVATIVLADTLTILQRDWPKLQVVAEVNDGDALLDALRAETLDFIVVEHRFVPISTELAVRRLVVDEIDCFVRPEHPLASQGATLAQLRRAALVSVPYPERVHAQLDRALRCRPGERCEFQVESNDFRALMLLASRTDVILLAPMRAVVAEIAAGQLVRLQLPKGLSLPAHFDIVHLARRTLSPAAERAIAAIDMGPGPAARATAKKRRKLAG